MATSSFIIIRRIELTIRRVREGILSLNARHRPALATYDQANFLASSHVGSATHEVRPPTPCRIEQDVTRRGVLVSSCCPSDKAFVSYPTHDAKAMATKANAVVPIIDVLGLDASRVSALALVRGTPSAVHTTTQSEAQNS